MCRIDTTVPMSQRSSGYERKPDEAYETVAWPVVALLSRLGPVQRAWDPCDRGSGQLVSVLRAQGVHAIGTAEDFLPTSTALSAVSIYSASIQPSPAKSCCWDVSSGLRGRRRHLTITVGIAGIVH